MINVIMTAGRDNITTFQVVDDIGAPYPLNIVTRIDVLLTAEKAAIGGGLVAISSQDVPAPIVFGSSEVSIRFGALRPYPGQYYPDIMAYDDNNPNGVVIAGQGYPTEILLQVDP